MKGAKRKPLHLALVDGTDNATRTNYAEPQANGEIGDPPVELTPDRRLIWITLLRDAPRFVLKSCDREAFRGMVNTVAIMRQAERKLCESDVLVVKTKSGNVINNPYLGVYNTACRNFMRIASELGYTPVARARIIAGDGETQDPIEQRFFK
jgi:P27 family predicted phage terminase small subunit